MLRPLAAVVLTAALSGVSWAQTTVTIGVVRDGPTAHWPVLDDVETELTQILGSEYRAVFKESPSFNAQWDPSRYRSVIQSALDDPEVDFILLRGALTSYAADGMTLTKPTVSLFPQRFDFTRFIDMEGDRSLKPNLAFIMIPSRAEIDIRAFREMVDFDEAYFVVGAEYVEYIDNLSEEIADLERNLDLDLEFLIVDRDIGPALTGVDADTSRRIAILASIPRITDEQRGDLIRSLNDRGFATFSVIGHHDVELGAFAVRTPDIRLSVVRRTALNLAELARGASTDELPVLLQIEPKLLINGRTAAQLGYMPTFRMQSLAEILYPEAIASLDSPLDMAEALALAEVGNASLSISTQQVVTAEKDKDIALSPLLPDLRFRPSYLAINPGADGLEQLLPDQQLRLGFTLSQMIYDDQRISNYRAQGRIAESTEALREIEKMDVYGAAGEAFLNFVLARILYGIQIDNLRLTENNLELARIRLDVGYSGRDEVYRWESEVARRRSELLAIQTGVEARRIALNRVLGIDQDTRWSPREIDVDPEAFPFLEGRLNDVIGNRERYAEFQEAVVQFAIHNAPELQSVDKQLEAQSITLNQRKRRWFLPSIQADLSYDYRIAQNPDIVGLPKSIPRVFLVADYPIFEGTRRANEEGRARSELNRLTYQESLSRQLVEQRARTAVERLESSFPSIALNQIAADNAERNLILVQDKYSQGLVNVTDLLSAQNTSFVADQQAAGAVYDFLRDLVEFQRSLAWFEDVKTEVEKDEFVRTLRAEMAQPGTISGGSQ